MNILLRFVAGLSGTAVAAFIGDKLYSEHYYKEDGFNPNGYDRDGYDREGFNEDGFDREGYNRAGFDKRGFNRDGYDQEGYDRSGYDSQGFDRRGFDHNGFNSDGLDSSGYNRKGYNNDGIDRVGFDFGYYSSAIKEMRELAQKAHGQMKRGELPYAFRDIRVDAEKVLKAILRHNGKRIDKGENLSDMIYKCKRSKLVPLELCEKLDGLRFQCNDTQHDTEVEKSYNEAHFCYKTLCEAIDYLEEIT